MVRRRLDTELVRRGLAESRTRAQQLIAQRRVTVSGAPAEKAARQVDAAEPVEVAGDAPEFVSRGGRKLSAALDRFALDCNGRRIIDAGSSTGGFTDCVLNRGAASVVAVDVGRNQLHERIRADSRVEVHEQTNIRHVQPGDVGGVADVVVADLSFISLRTVAESLVGLVRCDGDLVVLVKPQFEAGRTEADKGRGIVRDPAIWRRTLSEVSEALMDRGAAIMGAMASPITGADGNVEFLLHARNLGLGPLDVGGLDAGLLDAAVEQAVADQRLLR
ncbi:MAG: TlyA family RNA methyltransferase [Acidimicrobiaceae bacterium]|nr:TlyA family RNA methyltransferase [Acidimicrobiaceae bacterium]